MRAGPVALVALGFGLLSIASRPVSAQGTGCREHFDSTFALIQKVVFERHGCQSSNCHIGPAPAGGLDLSADVAYDNLIDRPVQSISIEQHPGLARVVPGAKGRSLLWLNLASATRPTAWKAPLRSMPIGFAPLTLDELEVVQLWIEHGATRDGVVPGTAELVDACLPPEKPLKVPPLAPPPEGLGVQLRAPQQVLPAQQERESCFVSYYDLTNQVPKQFLGDGDTFRFKRLEARQDPLSHHAVTIVYKGQTPIDDPVWGPFTCKGGAHAGTPCQPKNLTACGEGICASPPVERVACIGYGPGDASIGFGEESIFNTMGSSLSGSGNIYDEAPLKGILVWNSHAFNLTDEPATLDMWINFEFAAPEESQHRLVHFVDIHAINKMRVRAFQADEVCDRHEFPEGARVVELSSHMHQRGTRFRIFDGAFSCQGGPKDGAPCSPLQSDSSLPLTDLCAGAPCRSAQTAPSIGDCNHNLQISVDELLIGIGMALSTQAMDTCPEFDGDSDGAVRIDEVVAAVDAALHGGFRDGAASLVYTSLTYADPLILQYDPPKLFGGPGSSAAERTVTYCGLYDNGFSNEATVKRNSRVPENGQPCAPTHCAEGLVGEPCTQNADCNASPSVADQACDACTVHFGVSTEDEMFVLAGSYIRD